MVAYLTWKELPMPGKFVQFMFKIPSLPREIYGTLKAICGAEKCSHHRAVIAGIIALSHLSKKHPETLKEVWVEARKYTPNDKPATPTK